MNNATRAACAVTLLVPQLGLAADHTDSSAVIADPAADITDVFAWMDPSGDKLNLVLDIPSGGAGSSFSDAVQYVFHVESSPAFGTAGESTDIICTFDVNQAVSCWVGSEAYVTGDASSTAGLLDDSGQIRVFAGRRNDPFYFNISGFRNTISAVVAAAGSLSFDNAGCPALDGATSSTLVSALMTEPDGSPAQDDFAMGEVLALVVQVDLGLVNRGGPILAVWASTRR